MPESSIKCPICGKPVLLSDVDAPFCSARCRLLDLGNWASGSYRIPTPWLEAESHPSADNADSPRPDGDREAEE